MTSTTILFCILLVKLAKIGFLPPQLCHQRQFGFVLLVLSRSHRAEDVGPPPQRMLPRRKERLQFYRGSQVIVYLQVCVVGTGEWWLGFEEVVVGLEVVVGVQGDGV